MLLCFSLEILCISIFNIQTTYRTQHYVQLFFGFWKIEYKRFKTLGCIFILKNKETFKTSEVSFV
jgi:hypothetical protein